MHIQCETQKLNYTAASSEIEGPVHRYICHASVTRVLAYCVVNLPLVKIFNCFFNISRLYMNLTRINDTNKIVWEHLNIVGKQNSPEKSTIIHKHQHARIWTMHIWALQMKILSAKSCRFGFILLTFFVSICSACRNHEKLKYVLILGSMRF